MTTDVRARRSLLVLARGDDLRRYELDLAEVVVGRDPSADVVLDDERASRRHALLRLGGRATVEDLGSRNGTLLNGKPLGREPRALSDGDWLDVGSSRLRFLDPAARAPAAGSGQVETTPDALRALETALGGGPVGTIATLGPAEIDGPGAEDAILRVVLRAPAGPRLLVREEGTTREHPIETLPLAIGRERAAHVRLLEPSASAQHARIERRGSGLVLIDLGSRNGTLVNGTPVREHALRDGDLVRIGRAELCFRQSGVQPVTQRGTRRPVVIVPGLASCELWLRGERIWPNPMRLLSSTEARLREYWGELEVGQIVREQTVIPGLVRVESFGSLVRFLCDELGYRAGTDLLEFAYDWRRDNKDSARALAQAVARWRATRKDPTEKVVVVAHSMGGLVTRHWLARQGGADAVERVVFLGTPHGGSLTALQSLLSGVSLFPFKVANRKVRQLTLGFASVYQLLPRDACARFEDGAAFEPYADDRWLEPACRRHLEAARRFHDELRDTAVGAPATSVFGYEQSTLLGLTLARPADGGILVAAEERGRRGDGWVGEQSAVLPGSEIHPVIQQHGALHADRDVLRRLRFELLER